MRAFQKDSKRWNPAPAGGPSQGNKGPRLGAPLPSRAPSGAAPSGSPALSEPEPWAPVPAAQPAGLPGARAVSARGRGRGREAEGPAGRGHVTAPPAAARPQLPACPALAAAPAPSPPPPPPPAPPAAGATEPEPEPPPHHNRGHDGKAGAPAGARAWGAASRAPRAACRAPGARPPFLPALGLEVGAPRCGPAAPARAGLPSRRQAGPRLLGFLGRGARGRVRGRGSGPEPGGRGRRVGAPGARPGPAGVAREPRFAGTRALSSEPCSPAPAEAFGEGLDGRDKTLGGREIKEVGKLF